MTTIVSHVGDADLLDLLDKVIAGGGHETGRLWWRRRLGLVQGSALSPLLCNLFLHSVDDTVARLAASTGQGVCALRYADDVLVLGRDRLLTRRAMDTVRQAARRLRLDLRKPLVAPRPIRDGVAWLGVEIQPRSYRCDGCCTFGYVVPDQKVQNMFQVLTEMTAPPSERLAADSFNLGRWIVSLNDQLRQWRQAYMFADNAAHVFSALDEHARRRVGALLRHVTGLRGRQLFDTYRVYLPRGFWTWQVEGARLVTLAALAPQNPHRLIRRPAWQRPAIPSSQTPSTETALT
jgi:hypothetical protein